MPPKHAITYELHDKVLCKYKDYYYAGKIVNVSTKDNERMFTVHYQGWHKRHDAVVPESKVKQLFLPYTDENVARTTAELEAAKLEKRRRSKLKEVPEVSNPSPLSPPVTSRRSKVVKHEPILDVNSIKHYYGCLPKSLYEILEKDHDAVIHRRLLTKLPAAYPVDLLLVEFLNTYDIEIAWGVNMVTVSYGDEISCSHLNCLLQSCQMITDYFNMMLGKLLLYPPERDQYQSELLRQRLLNLNDANGSNGQPHLGSAILPDNTVPVRHSSVFGLPHLLRLFKCLAEKFSDLPQDSEPLVTLKVMTAEFVMFLEENRDKYFSVRRDYEPQE
ncbi:hypothetical protein V3C99_014412 [Haemonchus contortus]|uniref:MRG domain-containing protein n=1 Tax=Haemonchus contortus TaxID=6289 RepID=A0A7I4YRM1_HAECO